MNKRIVNSKGMTIVEVLVSVIIISLIMGVLFTLLLQVQKINSDSSKRSSVMLAQNVITKAIERDMIEIGVKAISSCEFDQFGFGPNVIDFKEDEDGNRQYNYECLRIEYNQSYDISDVGYLMIYKQSSTQDNPAWVMRYGRGYYNECEKDSVPLNTNWKETYSVVQKLDPEIKLEIMSSQNEVSYSAVYESENKYSKQKLNNGKLFIPIQDDNGYSYNIDLSFTFRLYNPDVETVSNTNVNFTCDNSNVDSLDCKCSGTIEDCSKTDVPNRSKDENGKYIYRCSEAKASLGSVIGMNKNFIDLSSVVENGIYASKITSIEFLTFENYSDRLSKEGDPLYQKTLPSVDVSYSQNGSNLMFFEKDTDGMYKLYITQSGGVKVYGNSLSNMFKNFTKLVSVDFSGFTTTGVTTMNSMFYNCPKLTTLKLFNTLDLSSVTDVSSMFYKCSSLTSSPFRGLNLPSILYANSTFSEAGLTGTFNYKNDFNAQNVVSLRTFLRKSKINGFILDYDNQEMPNLISINSMFSGTTSLKNSSFKNTVAKKLSDMEFVFERSTALQSSEFSNFIAENLYTLYGLYKGCGKLTTFSFENFDSSSVVNFSYMFSECSGLVDVDLDGLSYESAKYLTKMFYSCVKLQYVSFANEDSDASLDGVYDLTSAFYNCQAFRGFKGKHMTFHSVGLDPNESSGVHAMFEGAGSDGLTLDVSNLELYNCKIFTGMFRNSKYKFIDVRGIHSKVTSGTIDLSEMFKNSSIRYTFLNDAEFSTEVKMNALFYGCSLLTFVTTVNTDSDESINEYFAGAGELVKVDGKSPFDNLMTTDGYASDLTRLFDSCRYLRGFEDGYLDPIRTDDRTTSYGYMFSNSFNADILSSVSISEEDYKRVYQLVVPFNFNNSDVLHLEIFGWTSNLAVIKFKNASNIVVSSAYHDHQAHTFEGFASRAFTTKRVSSIDIYLGDLRVCRYYGSSSASTCSNNAGFSYMFSWLGISRVDDPWGKPVFTRYSVDGVDGYPLNIYLSDNCDTAKLQYKESKNTFNRSSNNKTNYIWPDGCSAD